MTASAPPRQAHDNDDSIGAAFASNIQRSRSSTMASTSNRDRRSSLERRCLSKAAKRLYRNNTKGVRKAIYAAECHQRGKPQLGASK
jgi:hypothetical protein